MTQYFKILILSLLFDPINILFGQSTAANLSNKNSYIEIFATGRFTSHAGYEIGIYEYQYSRNSIYLPRYLTFYKTRYPYDSVFEYFYNKIPLDSDSILSLTNFMKFPMSKKPYYNYDRLILITHLDSIRADTIFVNDYKMISVNHADSLVTPFGKVVKNRKRYYEMNDILLQFILFNLPIGLKDNWSKW